MNKGEEGPKKISKASRDLFDNQNGDQTSRNWEAEADIPSSGAGCV